MLTPTGTWCEDSWIVTSALLAETTRLKFLVAFRPNAISPTLAAQQAATFQRVSGGRLLLNIVSGGDDREQRRFGDWLDHDERYDRTDEFLTVLRGALSGTPTDFAGRYFHVEGATVNHVPEPVPQLYFGGASTAAEIVAARHVDVYLAWASRPTCSPRASPGCASSPPRRARAALRHPAARHQPRHRAAARGPRPTRLLDAMDPAQIDTVQQQLAQSGSVGQQRMLALHGGSRDALRHRPQPVGRHRPRARRRRHGPRRQPRAGRRAHRGAHALGFDELILSGHPHLEEAYQFGEGVLPILRRRGLVGSAGPVTLTRFSVATRHRAR